MKKVLGLTLITILAWTIGAGQSLAQNDNPYKGLPFKDRIFLGGDLGLSFGSYTYIRIAPMLGYRISDRLAVGAGPSYTYFKDSRYQPAYETSIYGGSVFGQYFIFEPIFLQTEFEMLNLDTYKFDPIAEEVITGRTTIPVWLVGGGYSERTAGGSGFFLSVLYDLIQDPNSPYPNNLSIRVGAFFGF